MDSNSENNKIVGVRIKNMRLNNNWTQKDLAQKLGLKNETAIANYEAGYSIPKDEIKYKLCEVFDCTMDYLMGKSELRTLKEYNAQIDDVLNEAMIGMSMAEYKQLTKIQKKQIRDFALFVKKQSGDDDK